MSNLCCIPCLKKNHLMLSRMECLKSTLFIAVAGMLKVGWYFLLNNQIDFGEWFSTTYFVVLLHVYFWSHMTIVLGFIEWFKIGSIVNGMKFLLLWFLEKITMKFLLIWFVEKTIETSLVNRVGELVPKKAITNDPFWLDMWRSE